MDWENKVGLNEAFGFVNIESMREGTPVIATKSAGALDIIKEGETSTKNENENEHTTTSLLDEFSKTESITHSR